MLRALGNPKLSLEIPYICQDSRSAMPRWGIPEGVRLFFLCSGFKGRALPRFCRLQLTEKSEGRTEKLLRRGTKWNPSETAKKRQKKEETSTLSQSHGPHAGQPAQQGPLLEAPEALPLHGEAAALLGGCPFIWSCPLI